MKFVTFLFVMLFSIASFAYVDSKTFTYDGSQDSIEMLLRSEKTHTEYRYEQRHTVCFRTETHYRRECHQIPGGGMQCHSIPYSRTYSYPCIETVRVGYEVKDYDVEAKVDLYVAPITTSLKVGETFKVTLDGDSLSVSANGSKNFFILLKKSEVQSQMTGGLKLMTAGYSAELVEAAPILKSLELTNIELRNDVLNFTMGPVAVPEAIGYRLTVTKAPILGSDTELFDRELNASEMELKASEANSIVSVNIQNLGVKLGSGRHKLTANAFFKYAGRLLNGGQFDRTQAGRTLILKR